MNNKKIHDIFSHEIGNGVEGVLGIDDDGKLYWNNEPVVTKSRISVDWWVSISAVAAAVSTVVMAIFAVLTYFHL